MDCSCKISYSKKYSGVNFKMNNKGKNNIFSRSKADRMLELVGNVQALSNHQINQIVKKANFIDYITRLFTEPLESVLYPGPKMAILAKMFRRF